MDKGEILCWKALYDAEEDLYNTGLEEELRGKLQKNEFATKEDLKNIIEWKFQGQLKGRRSLNIKRLNNVNPKLIVDISKLAFTADSDKTRLKLLTVIDGVGYAIATVILTFFNPQNYGILDFHAWNAIFQDGKKTFGERECLRFIGELRRIAREVDLPCRDVEKALFKKDKLKRKPLQIKIKNLKNNLIRVPLSQRPYITLCKYMLSLNETEERRRTDKELIAFIDKQVIDSLVYELYFKEKFEEDGSKTNLLGLVVPYLKDMEDLETDEEKLKVIKEVVEKITGDENVKREIEKIKNHEWVRIIEGR